MVWWEIGKECEVTARFMIVLGFQSIFWNIFLIKENSIIVRIAVPISENYAEDWTEDDNNDKYMTSHKAGMIT